MGRVAAVFLLRWTSLLPEPVLRESDLKGFITGMNTGGKMACIVESALRHMDVLSRAVLVCLAALFGQIMARHGDRVEVLPRLAGSLTKTTTSKLPAGAEALVRWLAAEAADDRWPPLQRLQQSMADFSHIGPSLARE